MDKITFIVQGFVRFADGYPARGIRVAAFDRDLRTEEWLGYSETARDGSYRIQYSEGRFLKRERGTADLVVKALVPGAVCVASPVTFNAPREAHIDLMIPLHKGAPPSLFEKVKVAVTPLLGDVKIEELEEDEKHKDLTFIGGDTGFEKRLLARFVLSHRLPARGLQAEFWFALLGGSFFQYSEQRGVAQHVTAVVTALPTLDAVAVRKALNQGFATRDIPERLREKVDAWIEAFLKLVARAALGDRESPTFLGQAVQHAGIESKAKRERLARLYTEHRRLVPSALETLEKEGFDPREIADLRTSFRLAELTRGDFSVVKMLKEQFDVRRPEQVRALAKHSEAEWVELIERKHRAGEIALPVSLGSLGEDAAPAQPPNAALYGRTLERQFREAFPTAAFAGGLERAIKNGSAQGVQRAETLSRFLDQHEDFDLLRTRIDDYLGERAPAERRPLGNDDKFRRELKAVQRVFKIAPTFETADAMLADGVHSAQMVYRMGESEFVRRYTGRGLSAEGARQAYRRAADTHAAALTIIGDLKALDPGTLPLALRTGTDAAAAFPNANNLFRSGDICSCEDCRSVLGAPAYFADMLMFVKDRKAKNPANTVKDILFKRRPDLGYLELGCENTNTTLPYVDVVCEVLERVIAGGKSDVELAGFGAIPGDPADAKGAVAAALATAKLAVGMDFSLSQVDPGNADLWVVHGDAATYLLKKKGTPSFFAELLPNTKTSSAELRAYPAYVDAEAYKTLRAARFPFGLPFDLFGAEVRAAFGKCNLQRWDLMRTLRGTAPPNNPTDADIAVEYFGISIDAAATIDEKRLIREAKATPAEQQEIWGEKGNAGWLLKVSNVKTFLVKTGLEYEELLALLDLRFVNPTGDILIEHLDTSCDTDKKVIQGLNAAKLDRIHRFLRLWRKLDGWKLWELDLVIRHPSIGAGALDESFLIHLYHFHRLKTRLGGKTTVEHVCSLFGDLNIETHLVRPHEKRADGLYQGLFLNKKLVQPLDAAFEVSAVNVAAPTVEKISGHRPVILAALGLREADLNVIAGLTRASDGQPYITDDLTLGNLSFLWRHAWLGKQLKVKPDEWKTLLLLRGQDLLAFANPKAASAFVEEIDHLQASGFSTDELNWLLAADRTSKSALKEADTARFLMALRTELQTLRTQYDPALYDILNPPADVDALTGLLSSLLQKLHRDEPAAQLFLDTLRDDARLERKVAGLPGGFDFPAAIKAAIPIRYDAPATTLRFTGLMTAEQQTILLTDASLAAVTGIAAYQGTIKDFFQRPRLAMKFLDPVFTAALANLPAAVDFKHLRDPALALRISYDAEQRLLRSVGILSQDEKAELDNLSADSTYRNAVNSLFTQPGLIAPPNERIWLQDGDLLFPLRDLTDSAKDNLKKNLATAVHKALLYLSKTESESAVVSRTAAQLGLTEGLTRRLLTHYAVLPGTLLAHLTGAFAATSGVVDYATLKITFDGWFWANRVATLWKKWNLTLVEWERVRDITAKAQILDFKTLPLDSAAAVAPMDLFLRTSRLMRLKGSLPETGITLLEVLAKLAGGGYAAPDFAVDVERLNEAWSKADVQALTAALDLAYPDKYLLAESWERIRRAFYFTGNLNGSVETVKPFAAPTMTKDHAKALKELLRSKLGLETWLTLSVEIQDVLRERKRDSLAAYLLSQPKPADAPTGKWENTNDLYAYYLLDVEMCSCQLTSRLVQASGSVQLFVQRCFMGLEPDIEVKVGGEDGDSAWRWWKWMRKYRVWEANRKVFLWPENWIEPELKKDRSPFFKDLENELLQNEVNEQTVEKAFVNYLEKLDGVAQLEIAGFYQEDDGDNAIIHVFGRTKGAEPHIYYYRRYDYRQWIPWEKVDLDIQGDYLVPAVVNRRLFLFWPIFTEVPDEASNSTVSTPSPNQQGVALQPANKRLRLQVAVSDYRQGKWTPKRVSSQYDESYPYSVVLTRKHYSFYPVDRSGIDGRFGVKYSGYSVDRNDDSWAWLGGAFEIAGCDGTPEPTYLPGQFEHAIRPEYASTGNEPSFLKWAELPQRQDAPENDLAFQSYAASYTGGQQLTQVLMQTPWLFHVSPPWHLSYLDKLLDDGLLAPGLGALVERRGAPVGSWLPFFYDDKKRTFFVLPSIGTGRKDGEVEGSGASLRAYYPDIKREFRKWEDLFEGWIRTWVAGFDLAQLSPAQRQQIEAYLSAQLPSETLPPFTDEYLRNLIVRLYMRYVHYSLGVLSLQLFQRRQFHFKNFYHPFVCDFAKLLHNPLQGIPGLMKRETQLKDSGFSFQRSYQPTLWVVDPSSQDNYPKEIVDFSPDGAYSPYNWELFFHAPLLIANSLRNNQRFEDAREWYHFIFNPIGVESASPDGSPMSKYWITKPFFETTDPQYVQQRIENILRMLAGDTSVPGYSMTLKNALEGQVLDWRNNPFEPHRIANYRTVAYQKTVFMKYLDNLIAWGDYLFRQDSMESINEATQLYVLAAELLGPRPRRIPPQANPLLKSFNELEKPLDGFANALVEIENLVPLQPALVEIENLVPLQPGTGESGVESAPLPMLYFCIPHNDKMLGYWDTVADRLYKIRHCMNIEGVVRQLALFEPPIDPGALVKAVAGGVDIGAALADLNAPLPLYRFNILLQKANEVCNDVKTLGAALLAALEKKDAEAMGLLRQSHEIRVLEAIKAVREKQIEDAKEQLAGVRKTKELSEIKKKYYESREFMNAGETVAIALNTVSTAIDAGIAIGYTLAGGLKLIPNFVLGASGFGGSPHAVVDTGGSSFGDSAEDLVRTLESIAKALDKAAAISSTIASYQRRKEEWDFQKDLASKELEQIDRQIAAAELRVTIAEKELQNHVTQIENAKAMDAFMKSKYTNQELYQWQVGQISGVYFQSYKLALDLAKRAERCFRFELGLADSSYITPGQWDSLKKGLLSGEKLQYDLRRLESAYLEQNRRELELTKHVSLALLDPLALVKLRETGRCFFRLPEELFDLDYPGHYFRRIKAVSLTLPCIAGPYTTISATLRLLKNSIRTGTKNGDNGYPRNTDDDGLPADDTRFVENNIPVKAVAASSGQNDSGLFELSFRDERYLPFEGAGAISEWSLELFTDLAVNNPDPANPDFGRPLRQFDYDSIKDVVLHVKYTAREDAGPFKNGAIKHLRDHFKQGSLTPSVLMLNLRRDFPTQWSRFLKPPNAALGNRFELNVSKDLFPMRDANKPLRITDISMLARCTDAETYAVTLTPPLPAGLNSIALTRSPEYGGLHFGEKDIAAAGVALIPGAAPAKWNIRMTRPGGGHLAEDEVQDVIVVLGYQWA